MVLFCILKTTVNDLRLDQSKVVLEVNSSLRLLSVHSA